MQLDPARLHEHVSIITHIHAFTPSPLLTLSLSLSSPRINTLDHALASYLTIPQSRLANVQAYAARLSMCPSHVLSLSLTHTYMYTHTHTTTRPQLGKLS